MPADSSAIDKITLASASSGRSRHIGQNAKMMSAAAGGQMPPYSTWSLGHARTTLTVGRRAADPAMTAVNAVPILASVPAPAGAV
jgi:hypothetical protein